MEGWKGGAQSRQRSGGPVNPFAGAEIVERGQL